MSIQGPGWIDEPSHDEPVELGQALAEWTAGHHHAEGQDDEAEPEEYDPGLGDSADDEGGMSEYRHYPDWQDVDRAEYEREVGL